MELKDVKTWNDYENYVMSQGAEGVEIVDKCKRIARVTGAAMKALKEIHMGMCIYDLDEMPKESATEIPEELEEIAHAV